MSVSSRWMRRLAYRCWQHRVLTSSTMLLSIGSAALDLLAPVLIMTLVDDAIRGSTARLPLLTAALVTLAVLRFAVSSARSYISARLAYFVHDDLRREIFAAAQDADGLAQDRMKIGQMVSRVTGDLTVIRNLLNIAPSAAGPIVLIAGALCVMTWISPVLTVVAVAVLPVASLPTLRTRRKVFAASWSAQQTAAGLLQHIDETLAGVRVVKNFGQEDREVAETRRRASKLFAEQVRCARLVAPATGALSAVSGFSQVCVLGLGGWLAIHGAFSTGEFLAFAAYLTRLVSPANYLADLVVQLQLARSSASRVFELVDSKPELRDGKRGLPDGPLAVKFDHVSFSYTGTERVLSDFSLEVPAGKVTAVVGTSGSGSSSVLQLLLRFYDVQAGAVCVGGLDVRTVKQESLRAAIGVVFEDDLLFSGPVRANIALGRPGASDEAIRWAAEAAQAHSFIEALPAGYGTRLEERGETLSGGQRQRIALARALLPDPRLLLLDDPTSSVDALTETAIVQTLREMVKGRTTLLVTHRRSTLAIADQIAVLDDGELVDVGTEAELRERCGLFRELFDGDKITTASARPQSPMPSALLTGDSEAEASEGGVTPALWGDCDSLERPPRLGPWGRDTSEGSDFSHGLAQLPRLKYTPRDITLSSAVADVGTRGESRYFRDLLAPLKWWLVGAACFVAVDIAGTAALPALFRIGIDKGILESRLDAVFSVAALGLVLTTASGIAAAAQAATIPRVGENVLYELRLRSYSHLLHLDMDFHDREPAGAVITRLTNDLAAISAFVQTGLANSIVNAATIIGVSVLIVLGDLTLGLIVLSALPLLVIATMIFRQRTSPMYHEARERGAAVNTELREQVSGLRVVQAFGHQQAAARVFARLSDAYRRTRMRAHAHVAIYFPFLSLLAGVVQAAVLAVGASRVQAGSLTPGVLVASVLYLSLFFNGIQQLSGVFDVYQQARVGSRRIYDLLCRRVPADDAGESPTTPEQPIGQLEFREVSFTYPGSATPAIQGVSLTVRAGEKVALVGATGAGKSTLLDLVARLHDVTRGAILLDGVDIRRINTKHYRRFLGVMSQETYLFSGSVADNIAYGRQDASRAEIETAARAVGAINAIAQLPQGFLQPISQRGASLSAGQRQLIALARAYLVKPAIVLLDEATAALDPATEATVLGAWEQFSRDKTVLVIAHRLTSAQACDRIVVMDSGRVVEAGCPDELLAKGGRYAQLWAFADGRT